MSDMVRRPEQCSPKSSPRGNRSPVVPRQDSSGTLKTTISLGITPVIVNSGPFYLMKEPPAESELTGATNLVSHHNLEHSYNKFCCGRKMKDQLSAFLPNLPGNIDTPGGDDNSSLRLLHEKPPIGRNDLLALTAQQLNGFRLHPGPIPDKYRIADQILPRKKHKHKKNKQKSGETPAHESQIDGSLDGGGHEKKHKKQKRHDEEKERKKKKKEKKKKKQKHVGVDGNIGSVGSASGGNTPIHIHSGGINNNTQRI